MLKIDCPNCGNRLQIPEKYAGTTGRCKHCNQKLIIPELVPAKYVEKNKNNTTPSYKELTNIHAEPLSETQCQQLAKFNKLKESGVLTEDEFSTERMRILSLTSEPPGTATTNISQPYSSYNQVPFYRKQWIFLLIYCFFFPIALVIMVTGDVYYRKKKEAMPFGVVGRVILVIIAILVILWRIV